MHRWISSPRESGLARLSSWLSMALGVAGVVHHLESGFFYLRTIKSLTYAAPFVAPLAYVGLGCLLLMNRMVETHSREWAEWVLFLSLGGFARSFALSLTDPASMSSTVAVNGLLS